MVNKSSLRGSWHVSMRDNTEFSYDCGHCSVYAGPSERYVNHYIEGSYTKINASIYICPNCNKPTFINEDYEEQVPGPLVGNTLQFLPLEIENLYDEARSCITVNAYTSSVLSCRKLLMNISVAKGAPPGKKFIEYVNFLEENHFIPPDSKEWVDHIRKKGNEATHDIPNIKKDDAVELMEFTEMLLRFVYELPGKMQKHRKQN